MVWVFFILLILVGIGDLIKKGIYTSTTNAVNETKENIRINKLNKNTSQLQEDWEKRVKQLNINLEESEYVLFYGDDETTKGMYLYIWAVEGALGTFLSLEQYNQNDQYKRSPLNWQINYLALKDIVGVYKRNDYCIIECVDIPVKFALEDYDKIKKVYLEAKRMTDT